MRAIYKKLILLFIILCIIKIGLSFLIPSPTMFEDEYYYSSMARSFYKDSNFMIYGSPSSKYGPVYPIILSFAYIFKDMRIVYFIFKIFGALLSSLIIFPAWLLAKEFLNERKALLVSFLCSILPLGFIFSFYVMSENLFYPLVLLTIYSLYKSFTEQSIKWDLLTGVLLGLVYLTKVLGVILVFIIFTSFLINLFIKKDLRQIKRKFILYFAALLTVLPWLIRNGLNFGWSLSGIMGYVKEINDISTEFSAYAFLYWILLYTAYLILATGAVIFILNLLSVKSEDKNLKLLFTITLVTVIGFILISSLHSAIYTNINNWFVGRPLGRYLEGCIPLMLILGFISLKYQRLLNNIKLKTCLILSFIVLISFKLFDFHLFPVNNIMLSYLGLISFGINYLIPNYRLLIVTILSAIIPFGILLFKNIRFKKAINMMGLFFILINIISFGMIYYNSNYRWEPLEQMQLGLWFNDNVDSTNARVLLDERDSTEENIGDGKEKMLESSKLVERSMRRISFWMNANVYMGNAMDSKGFDYIVSKHELNNVLLKQIGDFKLYKIK